MSTDVVGRAGPVESLEPSGLGRVLLAVVRITVGLLWINNVGWKVPPRFGAGTNPPQGLFEWVQKPLHYPVFAPYSWLVEHLVLPAFPLFAWGVFVVEACLGAFLLVGLATRFWAVVGLAQTVVITLSVLNTPGEWYWAYFLMFAAHLALLATAAGRAYGVDGVLRPVWRRRGGLVGRALLKAS